MSIRLVARAIASLSFVAASLSASAATYSGLVVFGDSLSDSGNNFLVQNSLGIYQPPSISNDVEFSTYPSAAGTYSNGPVWTQYLAQSLGLPLAPSVLGGNNYAFGGAQTATDPFGLPPSLRSQLNGYLAAPTTVVDPNALYIVAGGGNDIRVAVETHADAETLQAMVLQYGADVAGMVTDLKQAGAQHVLVLNVPNFGLTPMARELAQTGAATDVSIAMNQSLSAHLAGSGAVIFDTFGFMTGVVAAGTGPGSSFSNLTNACLVNDQCDLGSYLFWDGIHPTTQAHQMLAQAVLTTAVPEPDVAGMLALGLVIVALGARRRAAFQQG